MKFRNASGCVTERHWFQLKHALVVPDQWP